MDDDAALIRCLDHRIQRLSEQILELTRERDLCYQLRGRLNRSMANALADWDARSVASFVHLPGYSEIDGETG